MESRKDPGQFATDMYKTTYLIITIIKYLIRKRVEYVDNTKQIYTTTGDTRERRLKEISIRTLPGDIQKILKHFKLYEAILLNDIFVSIPYVKLKL